MTSTASVVIVGRYRLDSLIGAGGMGAVYRAFDLCDGREVAVKRLHPERLGDARALKYFRRERAAAGRIVHSNVVTVLAAGETATGEPYLVMQLVSGRPEIVRCEGSRIESDLYAVGTLLYELLTGATPFGGATPSQIVYRHLVDDVVPPSARRHERTLPRAIEDVVLWALEKDPANRPHSARAFACRLREALPEPEAMRIERSWPVPVLFSTTATTLCWKPGTRAAR